MSNINAIIRTAKELNIDTFFIQTFNKEAGAGHAISLNIREVRETNTKIKQLDKLNNNGFGISFRRNYSTSGVYGGSVRYWQHLVVEIDPTPQEIEELGLDVCLANQMIAVQTVCDKYQFPLPSLAIYTGNKSYHYYWKTDELDIQVGKQLQLNLIQAFKEIGVEVDKHCAVEGQPFRLPGFIHSKTGVESYIVDNYGTGETYDLTENNLPTYINPKQENSYIIASAGVDRITSLDDLNAVYDNNSDILPTPYPNSDRVMNRIKEITDTFVEDAKPGNRNDASFQLGLKFGSKLIRDLGVDVAFNTAILIMDDAGVNTTGNNRQTLINGLSDGFINYVAELREYDNKQQVVADKVTNDQYISVDFDNKKVCMLKSPIGTGKTTAVSKTIEDKINKQVDDAIAANPNVKILIVSHRIALCYGWLNSVKDFTIYNDAKTNLSSVDKLICSMDSIYRLRPNINEAVPQYDLVIVDEIDQALKHITTASTLKHNRTSCIETLWCILANAKNVIAASATISNREIDFLSNIVGRNEINVIDNQIMPLSKTFVKYDDESTIRNDIIDSLTKGNNIAVACNTKTNANALEIRLKELFPNECIVNITSDNSQKEKQFIININEQIVEKKVKVLIYSPSLGTGTDINVRDYFHEVFVIASKTECLSSLDLLQLAGRVRYPISNTVNVYVQSGSLGLNTRFKVHKQNLIASYNEIPTYIDFALNKVVPINQVLYDTVIDYIAGVRTFDAVNTDNLNDMFWKHVKKQGHTIITNDTVSDTTEKELIKEIKEELKLENIEHIAAAPLHHEVSIDSLRQQGKTRSLTKEEEAIISKFYITKNIGSEPTKEEIEWYIKEGKDAIRLQRIAEMTQQMAIAEDKYEREVMGKLPQDQTNYTDKHYVINKALELIPDSFDKDILFESGFVEFIECESNRIRGAFGRKVNVKNPVTIARLLLSKVGIKTDVVRSANDRTYKINEESRERMNTISRNKKQSNTDFNNELCYSRFDKMKTINIDELNTIKNMYHDELIKNEEILTPELQYAMFGDKYPVPF